MLADWMREVLWVTFFSYFGVVIREALVEMSDYKSFGEFHDFYAQIVGTLFLGFLTHHKTKLSKHGGIRTGLCTGLCGSITTFSGWQIASSFALIGWTYPQNSGFENFLIAFTYEVIGVGAVVSAFKFGEHLAELSPYHNKNFADQQEQELQQEQQEQQQEQEQQEQQDPAILLPAIGFGAIVIFNIIIIIFVALGTYERIFFSCLFAPFGAVLRWWLAKFNYQAEPFEKTEENREKTRLLGAKRRREEKEEEGERERRREGEEEGEEEEKRGLIIWSSQNFPGGTLVANLIGCVVLSCVRIVIEQNDCFEFQGDDGRLKMGVLVGLGAGFCGCLSTVSTFISELIRLPTIRSYQYGLLSLIVAQLLLLGTNGAYRWNYEGEWETCYETEFP